MGTGRKAEPGATRGRASSRAEARAWSGRRRLRNAALCLTVLLFALSVPWYRETGEEVRIVLGLPDWVTVALGCYIGVALLNALSWLLAEVPEDAPTEAPAEPPTDREGTP